MRWRNTYIERHPTQPRLLFPRHPRTMAFVSPSLLVTTPPQNSASYSSASSSAFGGKELPSTRALRLPSLTHHRSRAQAPTCIFGGFFQEDKEERSSRVYDFSTASQCASGTAPNHAEYSAHIVGLRTVSGDGHHFELTIDVAEFELGEKHMSPGQFIQIAVGSGSDRKMAYFTLSSPPGGLRDGSVQVIFTAKADPLSLHKMDAGKQLYVSLPMGVGMPHETVTNSKGDLFLFTDSVQGYSAAKSLVEWDYFRAVSGNGANRTNHVVIYYALPTRNSLPYPERLSSWSVFGVNVHPLPGISIMEHMSNPTPLGRPRHNLSQDHAFALVASPDTYEALFCACLLLGFRRTAVHRHTPDTIQKEVLISAANFSSQKSSDRHNFSNYYSPDAREAVEEEIWRNWVNVRESMREEFERKWSAKSRMERDQFMDFKSKSQAWESWFAHNKNQWDQMAWDQEQWGKYWGSWKGSAGGGGTTTKKLRRTRRTTQITTTGGAVTAGNLLLHLHRVERTNGATGARAGATSKNNAAAAVAYRETLVTSISTRCWVSTQVRAERISKRRIERRRCNTTPTSTRTRERRRRK